MKICLEILRKAILLYNNRRLPEMKVSRSHNKKISEMDKLLSQLHFGLRLILNNVHRNFLSCSENFVRIPK